MVNLFKQHINSTKVLFCLCGLALALSILVPTAYHPYIASAVMLKSIKTPKASTTTKATGGLKVTKTPKVLKYPKTTFSDFASHIRNANNPHFASTSTGAATWNWAGYATLDKPGSYHQAIATFTIPTITGAPDANRMVALWAGVGGTTTKINDSLIQAGVFSVLMPPDQSSSVPYQINLGWYEAFPNPPVGFNYQKGLSAGDSITAQITSYKEHNIVNDIFSVKDNTTGETGSHTDNILLTDGASAECIVERPFNTVTNDFLLLPQFGTAKLDSCQVAETFNNAKQLSPIGNFTNLIRIDMVNFRGALLASSSALAGKENFTTRRVGDHK